MALAEKIRSIWPEFFSNTPCCRSSWTGETNLFAQGLFKDFLRPVTVIFYANSIRIMNPAKTLANKPELQAFIIHKEAGGENKKDGKLSGQSSFASCNGKCYG